LVVAAPGAVVPTVGAQAQLQQLDTTVGDGWRSVEPASEGIDGVALEAAREYAFQADRNTQGVVVTRGGRLVAEWYAPDEGPRSWGASWSMAKSFTSALVGIAIDEGKISDVNVSMAEYFPDWAGTAKANIRLVDVLHMESGLKWNEDYNASNLAGSDIIQMGMSPDQLAYAASRPVEVAPGTRFNYSSGDTMLLSKVIESATGMPADQYAREKLFGPLGMDQVEWWRDAKGHTLTYCCLDTTSRNYARMGLLYLQGGSWNGNQIISSSWVQNSLTGTAASNGNYGYQWWIRTHPAIEGPIYMMNGFDGQMTFVIPSLDMVVVRNGDYVKSECEPVADPNLFGRYPPSNLIPGKGTRPPASWNNNEFLGLIVDAVTGAPSGATEFPTDQSPAASRSPQGEPMAPCPPQPVSPTTTVPSGSTPTTTSPTNNPSAVPATPISAAPAYTG